MAKKDALGQDMLLLGVTGPLQRWLIMQYCALTHREMEYVCLTRDSTEGDLKQRREIAEGGTSLFVDQAVVRAAIQGRLLVIDCIEQARALRAFSFC